MVWSGIAVLVFSVVVFAALSLREPMEHYSSFKSPSGEYELIVLAKNRHGLNFPGQSGDRSGVVLLKNAQGETLDETTVDMVQLIDSPVWEKDRVFVKLVFDFDLKCY